MDWHVGMQGWNGGLKRQAEHVAKLRQASGEGFVVVCAVDVDVVAGYAAQACLGAAWAAGVNHAGGLTEEAVCVVIVGCRFHCLSVFR